MRKDDISGIRFAKSCFASISAKLGSRRPARAELIIVTHRLGIVGFLVMASSEEGSVSISLLKISLKLKASSLSEKLTQKSYASI